MSIASRYFDKLAIALSALCIVHCLAVPLLVALLPVAAFSLGSDAHFHGIMLWLVVPTSVFGFGLGYRVHGRASIVSIGVIGIAMLAASALWGHSAWNEPAELLVSVAGSFVLAYAHLRNFREVRRLHTHI